MGSHHEHFASVLAAAQANSGPAFEELFSMYAPRVRGYLAAHGAAEPDELTNDVFMAVFDALSRFTGTEASFRSWLFTIARNKLVDDRRRRARHVTVIDEPVGDHHLRHAGNAEVEAMENLGSAWVSDVLAGLAPQQREVLVLRIVADLTIDQIARLIGKRPGAVKALQRRGLATVRREIERQGVPLRRSLDV